MFKKAQISCRFFKRPMTFLVVVGLFLVLAGPAQAATDVKKEELRKQLAEIEKQISQYQDVIGEIQKREKTLEREVALLENQVREIQLQINAIDLSLREIDLSVRKKQGEINDANFLISQEKIALAQNIRLLNEKDDESLLEILMKNDEFSSFFDAINSLHDFQQGLQEKIDSIRELKIQLKEEQEILDEQRIQFNQLKVLQEVQKLAVVEKQNEQKQLLLSTQGQEAVYQRIVSQARQDAATIRNQLFQLAGGGAAMTLEQAYMYASLASQRTGVRPAFLLALLKRETQWGKLTGTGNWRTDMNPKDHNAFLQICQELNLDPDKVAVSKAPSYGWGGAMGPAQFLPRTWLALKDKIAQITGHNPPNPWSNEDAFTAAAYKLVSNGAKSGDRYSEWKAAQIYFAGGNWAKPAYSFYGNSVMDLADDIQEQLQMAELL